MPCGLFLQRGGGGGGGGQGHDLVERHHDGADRPGLQREGGDHPVVLVRVQQPVFAGLADERGQLVGCVDGADVVGRRMPVSRRTALVVAVTAVSRGRVARAKARSGGTSHSAARSGLARARFFGTCRVRHEALLFPDGGERPSIASPS